MATVIFHTRRMCREALAKYQLMNELLCCASPSEVGKVVRQLMAYRDGKATFQWDDEKEEREKEARDRKKHEEGKRKSFEDRMRRKAKRDGKEPDFYLSQGLEPPTQEAVQQVTALPEKEQVPWWRGRYSQHCFAFHTGTCARGRACAFLHTEINGGEDFAAKWNEA